MRLIAKIFVLVLLMIPAAQAYDAKDMKQFYAEDSYPTAAQCAGCHQQIYNEWASSNHAYASISLKTLTQLQHNVQVVINKYTMNGRHPIMLTRLFRRCFISLNRRLMISLLEPLEHSVFDVTNRLELKEEKRVSCLFGTAAK